MSDLRERFHETAATEAPPSRLSAKAVYAAAWRRRRVRTAKAVGIGGFTALLLVVAATSGPVHPVHEHRTLGPRPHPSSVVDNTPSFRNGSVEEATATDADHLYAIRHDCADHDPGLCQDVLVGSADAGRTWTVLVRDVDRALAAPAPGQLVILVPLPANAGPVAKGEHARTLVSGDGGRTWTVVTGLEGAAGAGTVPEVPAGGWLACGDAIPSVGCTLYAVDPHSGAARRLATQPPVNVFSIPEMPASAGLWVTGKTPDHKHAAVGVSLDHGKTWAVHVFGQDDPDYPTAVNDASATPAALDGVTAYTIVSVTATDPAQRRSFVYRSDDGGLTWQRTDPLHTVPYTYEGTASYVAPDGTHVVAATPQDTTQWYVSHDGGATYHLSGGLTGLTGLQDLRGSIRVVAPGVYVAHDSAAIYHSTDGLHWTRVPVPRQPR